MMKHDQAEKAIGRAIKAARAGYEFDASSYTYAAFVECLRARDAILGQPDWITAYLDYAAFDALLDQPDPRPGYRLNR